MCPRNRGQPVKNSYYTGSKPGALRVMGRENGGGGGGVYVVVVGGCLE